MEAPPTPRLAEPNHPALARAALTATALEFVAQRFGRPVSELQRTLSRRDLERETARAIVAYAHDEAARLLRDNGVPPVGEDATSQAIRRIYHRLKARREAEQNAEAERRLAEKAQR